MFRRYAFACAYLACYLVTELVYVLLSPHAQAALSAWASTSVANLEHEPAGPLVLAAFVAPGYFAAWPVLIALAVFGANRALGTISTALICVAGHVIGTAVSEGIVAYRVDAGQLPPADRYLTDVGPSYVVVSAIVIAIACGTWLARAAAALDFAVLVVVGHIFGGLSHLDVSAVGHLTALVTAAASVILILARRSPAAAASLNLSRSRLRTDLLRILYRSSSQADLREHRIAAFVTAQRAAGPSAPPPMPGRIRGPAGARTRRPTARVRPGMPSTLRQVRGRLHHAMARSSSARLTGSAGSGGAGRGGGGGAASGGAGSTRPTLGSRRKSAKLQSLTKTAKLS